MPIIERQQQNSSEHRMLGPKHIRHAGQATSMPVCMLSPKKIQKPRHHIFLKGGTGIS